MEVLGIHPGCMSHRQGRDLSLSNYLPSSWATASRVHGSFCVLWESVGQTSGLTGLLCVLCLLHRLPALLLQFPGPVWDASEQCGKTEQQEKQLSTSQPTIPSCRPPPSPAIHFPSEAGTAEDTRSVVLLGLLAPSPGQCLEIRARLPFRRCLSYIPGHSLSENKLCISQGIFLCS